MLSWKFDFAVHQQKYDDFILLILKYLHQKVFLLFYYFIMITTVIIKYFFTFPYLHKKKILNGTCSTVLVVPEKQIQIQDNNFFVQPNI